MGESEAPLISGRYSVQGPLGEGGMATVHRVLDLGTQRVLALKRLRSSHADKREVCALFEREYQTLVELTHPNIVEAYDYGFDGGCPYYTMELLLAADVASTIRGDWRRIVCLLRDVASALTLMHSRAKIHRDVTMKNVRYVDGGRAKLIDFGALTPVGVPTLVVGTPPHIAPEALHLEALDGRADLFSLGALAYVLLTGRHAFPARRVQDLPALWLSKPLEPSAFVPGIPRELDRLVLALLSTDKLGRPASAAEVIDRIDGLLGRRATLQTALTDAYLTTPVLIEREAVLGRCRRHVALALRGRGGVLMVKAGSGLGKTRLLAACAVEARMLGATVVRVDTARGRAERFAGWRALLESVRVSVPEAAQAAFDAVDAGLLVHILPELKDTRPGLEPTPFREVAELRARLANAVVQVFLELGATHCLVLLLDDLQRADRELIAVLISIARQVRGSRLLLLTSMLEGSRSQDPIVAMLVANSRVLRLAPLSEVGSGELIASVFDDAPRAALVAEWIFTIAHGNPGVAVQLAQHLVDHGLARHAHGVWTLPEDIESLALPQNLEDALAAQVTQLSLDERTLGAALALATERSPLRAEHYPQLLDPEVSAEARRLRVDNALAKLCEAHLLAFDGVHATFPQRNFARTSKRLLTPDRASELHRRLAQAYRDGGYGLPLLVAYHLGEAGHDAEALEVVFQRLISGGYERDALDRNYPLEVICHERALATAAVLSRPRAVTSPLLGQLLSLAHHHDLRLEKYVARTIADLSLDLGLEHWDACADSVDTTERMQRCMKLAAQTHAATPEAERGLSPTDALRALGIALARIGVICLASADVRLVCAGRTIFDRIAGMSPAVHALHDVYTLMSDTLLGVAVEERRLHTIEHWRTPIAGLPPTLQSTGWHLLLHQHAFFRSLIGNPDAATSAETLEEHAHYAGLAWDVRMCAQLFQGHVQRAEAARERRDLAVAHGVENHRLLSNGVWFEARSHVLAGDLMGLKRALDRIQAQAQLFPGWSVIERWACAEYHRLRGEAELAYSLLHTLLSEIAAGTHVVWSWAMSSYLELAAELDAARTACTQGLRAYDACRERNLSHDAAWTIGSSLAFAQAKAGEYRDARQLIAAAIDECEAYGGGGVPLARLYEQRARIACLAGDTQAFHDTAQRVAACYFPTRNPALRARYESLLGEQTRAHAASEADRVQDTLGQVRTRLERCSTSLQRAQSALALLIESTQAAGGLLYLLQDRALTFAAGTSNVQANPALSSWLNARIAADADAGTTLTAAGSVALEQQPVWLTTAPGCNDYAIRWLTMPSASGPLTVGVAVLAYPDGRRSEATQPLVEGICESLRRAGDVTCALAL